MTGTEETVTVNTFLVVNQKASVSLSSSKPAGEEFFTAGRSYRVACNMAGYRVNTSTARYGHGMASYAITCYAMSRLPNQAVPAALHLLHRM